MCTKFVLLDLEKLWVCIRGFWSRTCIFGREKAILDIKSVFCFGVSIKNILCANLISHELF